jgi:hypothetical protein
LEESGWHAHLAVVSIIVEANRTPIKKNLQAILFILKEY